ncbi:MAG: ABC-2 family transporter protein [Planctomycetaceae bacterium]
MSARPAYSRVWLTFFRNSLVREMTFRGNFLITVLTRTFYFAANLALFEIIYRAVPDINGWNRWEYYAFMATGMLINALVETFFMPNCANFSELIRTGNLDFALLKPIDTQFLVSFEKVEIAMVGQVALSLALLGWSLVELDLWSSLLTGPGLMRVALYALLVGCGVAFFYSLMIILSATSIWFGRNQGLYDFWFYVTIFARYPREIWTGSPTAAVIQDTFTYFVPILLVVTIPARVLAKTVDSWQFVALCIVAAVGGLIGSRIVFQWSLRGYRSASS